jgi:hypothetical protein
VKPRAWLLTGAVACCGCGASDAPDPKLAGDQDERAHGLAADDQSRCDFKGRKDREVIESTGPGAVKPNIRRVFASLGDGSEGKNVLLCREVDTNLDGVKDVFRLYDDKGESKSELVDSDYDGRIDTWVSFSYGRISKVEVDTNRDAKPDETRYYVRGKLSRIQRDTNQDGKADVWEIYSEGRLHRMGEDLDHDGHVDRWNRDEVLARQLAEKEREEELEEERSKDAGARSDAGAPGDAGAPPARPKP